MSRHPSSYRRQRALGGVVFRVLRQAAGQLDNQAGQVSQIQNTPQRSQTCSKLYHLTGFKSQAAGHARSRLLQSRSMRGRTMRWRSGHEPPSADTALASRTSRDTRKKQTIGSDANTPYRATSRGNRRLSSGISDRIGLSERLLHSWSFLCVRYVLGSKKISASVENASRNA